MAVLTCPFCQSKLFQIPLHGRASHVCPQNHGRGIYASAVRKWVTSEFLPTFDKALAAAVPGQRLCPSCRLPMHVPLVAGKRIDNCRRCSLIWVDPGELEAIPQKSEKELNEEVPIFEQTINEGFIFREGCSPFENIKGERNKLPFVTIFLVLMFTGISHLARHSPDQSIYIFQPAKPFLHFGIPALLALFTHADFWHFLGNSSFLFFVGQIIENTLGENVLLEIFFLAGLAGEAILIFTTKQPTVGASGAISGLVIALLFTQPQARFVMPFQRWTYFELYSFLNYVPIWAWGAIWILTQASGVFFQLAGQGDGISYLSHAGGAAAGIFYVIFTDLKAMAPKVKARKV